MFLNSDGRRRPRRWLLAAGGVLLVAGIAVAVYLIAFKKPGNYNNKNAEFESGKPAQAKPKLVPETFKWPIYGYTPQRTRYLEADAVKPPFRQLWKFGKGSLIEFQPVLANGVLYVIQNDGNAYAINAAKGRIKWKRKLGSLNASSPAWDANRLYTVSLSRNATALDARTGKVLWKKDLPSRSESSPIVIKGRVYFGSEDGTVYALRAKDGKTLWTYHAAGAVKAGLAYNKGNLYFGDYAGGVYALRAGNGREVWNTGTSGLAFNRSGNFYSTPAVAFGRVYLGNTDGFVYSFVARTGQLGWRHATGNYVYSAPAVGDVPGVGPTVYIGSYDGNFSALDAHSGNVRWNHSDGGKISGAPTVVGRVVYFSNLGKKTTSGLDVATGKRVWHLKSGAFNPVISDGKRIYLTGYSSLLGLVPRKKRTPGPKRPRAGATPAPTVR